MANNDCYRGGSRSSGIRKYMQYKAFSLGFFDYRNGNPLNEDQVSGHHTVIYEHGRQFAASGHSSHLGWIKNGNTVSPVAVRAFGAAISEGDVLI